jgi:hypothetical protein
MFVMILVFVVFLIHLFIIFLILVTILVFICLSWSWCLSTFCDLCVCLFIIFLMFIFSSWFQCSLHFWCLIVLHDHGVHHISSSFICLVPCAHHVLGACQVSSAHLFIVLLVFVCLSCFWRSLHSWCLSYSWCSSRS